MICIILTTWRSTHDHQQPKCLRAGLGWCVESVPLPSGPNTGSNPGEGWVLKKNHFYVLNFVTGLDEHWASFSKLISVNDCATFSSLFTDEESLLHLQLTFTKPAVQLPMQPFLAVAVVEPALAGLCDAIRLFHRHAKDFQRHPLLRHASGVLHRPDHHR